MPAQRPDFAPGQGACEQRLARLGDRRGHRYLGLLLRPARPTRSRPSRSRSVCAPKPSARPYSVNRLGFPSPARPVPEQRPGQVSVLANAHILGHGDDAVQRSNHVCRGEETLPALTPRVRSSLARNRKHELYTPAHLRPRPTKVRRASYLCS